MTKKKNKKQNKKQETKLKCPICGKIIENNYYFLFNNQKICESCYED